MTVAPTPTCQHTYVCTLTENRCIWCGHIEGTPGNQQNRSE